MLGKLLLKSNWAAVLSRGIYEFCEQSLTFANSISRALGSHLSPAWPGQEGKINAFIYCPVLCCHLHKCPGKGSSLFAHTCTQQLQGQVRKLGLLQPWVSSGKCPCTGGDLKSLPTQASLGLPQKLIQDMTAFPPCSSQAPS